MAGISRVRTRAPELTGRGWLNSPPLTLAVLRGQVVLLDFFTSGCVNCRHVQAEIARLESRFGAALTVIAVHSPKFPHEAEPAALRTAVERLRIAHPVLDDGDHRMLEQYAVRAWPTLVLIGPAGRIEAVATGEGHGEELARIVAELLDAPWPAGEVRAQAVDLSSGGLSHPGGLVRLRDGDLLVADAGNGAVTRLDPAGGRVLQRYGGLVAPAGLEPLPDPAARALACDVVVADPVGHRLVGLDLEGGALRPLAGTGERRVPAIGSPGGTGIEEALASPEDVVWWPELGVLAVAMAGLHQLWSLDPWSRTLGVLAGTGREQLRDGPASGAWLAQPTALAVSPADGTLWWVDAESSALRRLAGGRVTTLVGTGLFAFGFEDGPVEEALLQHPQGLAVLPDGALLVCDTYNGALRGVDPVSRRVTTLATGLDEPVAVVPAADNGEWLVLESAASRVTSVRLRPLAST